MSDERISEPPALEGELSRWEEEFPNGSLWWAVDSKGDLYYGAERWARSVASDIDDGGPSNVARRRLAAELAACRARRDEGDGQTVTVPRAWLSVLAQRAFGEGWMRGRGVEPAQGALAVNGLLGTVHGDWEKSQAAIEGEIDAALLARRATATTVTPAGEETQR